jgi:hypothetical protein
MRRIVRSPIALFVVAVLIGLGVGAFAPLSQAAPVFPHPDHECKTITCAAVQAQTCANNGWCRDNLNMLQFPKCMPRTREDCSESTNWGSKDCDLGRCIGTGAQCSYVLRFCIPNGGAVH